MACPDVSRCEHGGGSGARGPMSLGRTLAMLRDARILAGKSHWGLGSSGKQGAKKREGRSRRFEKRVNGTTSVRYFHGVSVGPRLCVAHLSALLPFFLWNGSAGLLGDDMPKGPWTIFPSSPARGGNDTPPPRGWRRTVESGGFCGGLVDILPHGERLTRREARKAWRRRRGTMGIANWRLGIGDGSKPSRSPEPVTTVQKGGTRGATNGL